MLEVNKFGNTFPVIADEDIVEGTPIKFTGDYADDWDFGSRKDIPKVVKADAGSLMAFVIMLAPDNRDYPLYEPVPRYDWALRGGFDRPANTPFQATVYLTDPAVMEGNQVVKSGNLAVALGPETVFTVGTDSYTGSPKPGEYLSVDASGKFAPAGYGTQTQFQVVRKNDDDTLTIRIYG